MKQTNNAIKFLMAQYRAIFKNANIAMVAAIAAAALAAGQAQAAPITGDNFASLDADQTATDKALINIASGKTLTNTNKFTILVTSGSTHSIDGGNTGGDPAQGPLTLTAENVSLKIAGTGDNSGSAVLDIGKTSGATVTLSDVDIANGTLTLTKGSLEAKGEKGIVLGDKSKLATADDNSSILAKKIVLKSGSLLTLGGGKVESADISLASGSSAEITKGSLGKEGATITLVEGATIEGKGADADAAKVLSNVIVSGGTLTSAATKLTLDGSLTVESGEFKTDTAGEAKVNGVANLKGKNSFHNSGTAIFNSDVEFADGSVNAAGKGTVKFGATATMSKATLETLIGGAEVGAVDGKHAVIDLSSESGAVALAGASSDPYIFKNDDGTVNTKLSGGTGGSLTLKGKEATFTAHTELNGDIGLSFDTMTLGKTSGIDLKGGVDLVVGKLLTVKADSNAALKVTSGSVTLDGASGSVAAKTITLNGSGENAKFNVNGGVWEVQSLVQTQGTSKVTSGSTLNVKGDLTLTAGTMTVDNKSNLNIAGKLETYWCFRQACSG